jgi:Tfp pilus assembly protein PilP
MNYSKILAKTLALAALALWCIASSGAAQMPKVEPSKKPIAAQHMAKKPIIRKRIARAKHQAARRRVAVRPRVSGKPAKSAAVPSVVPVTGIHPPVLPELTHGRDPFAALIRASDPNSGRSNLPPGIGGLQVATIQLQGMVKAADGMVAVVANPQDRVYFLHDGDHVYDGVVENIGLNSITFRQQSKDAFGRTVDREVSKRLYPIAGDAQ